MNNYNSLFKKAYDFEIESGVRNIRNSIFWLRFYPWLFQLNWIKCTSIYIFNLIKQKSLIMISTPLSLV